MNTLSISPTSHSAAPVTALAPVATFSYRYANVPFKRYETTAYTSEIRYAHRNEQGGYDFRVVPLATPVSGSLDDAVRAARELSRAHDVHPVIGVLAAGEGAWTLSPLQATFAMPGGETQSNDAAISPGRTLFGPLLGIGVGKLTTDGLRVQPTNGDLKAIVDDGTGLLTFA
ncbi:MAG: hypothetical protein JWN72_1381 [Thermoleophilia bacterium]|nr:hypothetical protein [Thermoleophilia bacterium]